MENMQETLQVESCIKAYPWLIQMVKSKQFHKSCDKHITKQRCYFCCECMISPLCDVCYHGSHHRKHTTIQTFKCSHQSGVETQTLSKYMDTSGMNTYKINQREIYFINQRREKKNHRCRKNIIHKCVVCEWEIEAAYAFCSIECKFRFALGSQLDELMENFKVVEPLKRKRKHYVDELMEHSEVVGPRKHRRKGIPHRAPFY